MQVTVSVVPLYIAIVTVLL